MKTKLCFVVSSPMTAVNFLNGHIDFLSKEYEVTVVCKFDGGEKDISQNASTKDIRIDRKISPMSDARATYQLTKFLAKGQFQIVHSVTPKAGLVTAIAGWLAGIPIRIHWYTGQVWVLKAGLPRWLMKRLDRLIATLDTSLLIDSPSQREFLINEGVVSPDKSEVLGSGSIAGVDTEKFRPCPEARVAARAELGIDEPEAPIIIFVGRLNHDKGIETLLKAFSSPVIQQDAYLLFVGPDEENYSSRIPSLLGQRVNNYRYVPFTTEPEKYMAASDIFCLPSLREGFGLVTVEAGASGLACVASEIYGVTDSLKEGETGLLVKPGNVDQLAQSLQRLLTSPSTRQEMGILARARVKALWRRRLLQESLRDYYSIQLTQSGEK